MTGKYSTNILNPVGADGIIFIKDQYDISKLFFIMQGDQSRK
jgi:hypothetical protein